MRSEPKAKHQILAVLRTYGEVNKRMDYMDSYAERTIYCLYFNYGVFNASGYTGLTSAQALYKKTYNKMWNMAEFIESEA